MRTHVVSRSGAILTIGMDFSMAGQVVQLWTFACWRWCLLKSRVFYRIGSRKTLHFPKHAPCTCTAYLSRRRHADDAGAGDGHQSTDVGNAGAGQAIRCDGTGELRAIWDGVSMFIGTQHQDPRVEHPPSYTATAASPMLERHLQRGPGNDYWSRQA